MSSAPPSTDLDHARERLFFYGLEPEEFERELSAQGGDARAALRHLLAQRAEEGDLCAVLGMTHAAADGPGRRRWLLIILQSQMDEWRLLGHETLEVQAPPGMACVRCAPLHGSQVSSAARASELVPADCPRMTDRRCCVHLCIAPTPALQDSEDGLAEQEMAEPHASRHSPSMAGLEAPSGLKQLARWWASLVGRQP